MRDTTFFQPENQTDKYISVPYNPQYTNGLAKIFKQAGMKLVFQSGNTLRHLLGNPKDKIHDLEKSGIYEVSCTDCDKKYVGQTRRSLQVRFKEHMAHLKYGRTEKSSIAEHAFDHDHTISIDNLKLLKNVSQNRFLDAFESIEIVKCKNRLNKDRGPIPYSPLYSLID